MKCIDEVDGDKGYKYLGIREAIDIKHGQMKDRITKEYVKRVLKIVPSKLSSGITIGHHRRHQLLSSISDKVWCWNHRLDETKEDLKKIDGKTTKIPSMNRMLHPQSDVDRLYIPRKEGGRGLD